MDIVNFDYLVNAERVITYNDIDLDEDYIILGKHDPRRREFKATDYPVWAVPASDVFGYNQIQDESIPLPPRQIMDFQGAGVTVTDDPINNKTVITIPGGGVGGYTASNGVVLIGNDFQLASNLISQFTNDSGYITSGAISGMVTGSGTLNYIPKWTPDGTTLGDSIISESSGILDIGAAPSAVVRLKLLSLDNADFTGVRTYANNGLQYSDLGWGGLSSSYYLKLKSAAGQGIHLLTDTGVGVNTAPLANTMHGVKGSDATFNNFAGKFVASDDSIIAAFRNDKLVSFGGNLNFELGNGLLSNNNLVFATDTINGFSLKIGRNATGTNQTGESYISLGAFSSSTENGIAIGVLATVGLNSFDGLAIGRNALSDAGTVRAYSIGRNANSKHNNSWALGYNAVTTADDQFNFGANDTAHKYIFNGSSGAIFKLPNLFTYANNAAAIAGGLTANMLYIRTGHGLDIVV